MWESSRENRMEIKMQEAYKEKQAEAAIQEAHKENRSEAAIHETYKKNRAAEQDLALTPVYQEIETRKLEELYLRDPFLFPDRERGWYFLYGTNMDTCDGAANLDPFFETWISRDLQTFQGPYLVFRPEKGFWGVKHYWAPEVHAYRGAYYMFATFKGGIGEDRGTAVLKAERPEGPFREHSKGHVTLKGHECLDGTFYVDSDGKPWVVFCHEWTELFYGKIKALPLKEDQTGVLDVDPIVIVDTETDCLPWIRLMHDPRVRKKGYLTDAPYFHRLSGGALLMMWSSYTLDAAPDSSGEDDGGYVIAGCISRSGKMEGPWEHIPELLLDHNAGHSALFYDLEGNLKLISHCNDTKHGQESPIILDVREKQDGIQIIWRQGEHEK